MTDLKKIFQLCVTTLSEICKIDGPFSDNALMLIKSLLQIAEGTLTWAFISAANILLILDQQIFIFLFLPAFMFFLTILFTAKKNNLYCGDVLRIGL